MDPKQTEGQNGPSTLSTGANVSRTMDDLNVNDRKSATSNSPFAKHQFNKIAPGTGDIIIDQSNGTISSAPGDKEPKINRGRLIQFGLIFGGIALVGLVIFTVVMVINNQSKTNNNSGTNNNSSNVVVRNPKDAFEDFLEMLITGESGKTTYTAADGKTYSFTEVFEAVGNNGAVSDNVFYADQLINSDTSWNRNNYIGELSNLLTSFSSNYSGENSELVEQISYYYEDFANVLPVVETDIAKSYNDVGYDQTASDINESYGFNEDRGINDYNTYSRDYALATLNLLNEIKTKSGCEVTDAAAIAACTSVPSAESYQGFLAARNTYFTTAQRIKQNARMNALNSIGSIYTEYYGSTDEEEAQ